MHLQVQELFSGLQGLPLSAEDIEALTSNEFNRLASIFADVLSIKEDTETSFQVRISFSQCREGAQQL